MIEAECHRGVHTHTPTVSETHYYFTRSAWMSRLSHAVFETHSIYFQDPSSVWSNQPFKQLFVKFTEYPRTARTQPLPSHHISKSTQAANFKTRSFTNSSAWTMAICSSKDLRRHRQSRARLTRTRELLQMRQLKLHTSATLPNWIKDALYCVHQKWVEAVNTDIVCHQSSKRTP